MTADVAIRLPPPWTLLQLADLVDPNSDRSEELHAALSVLGADATEAATTYYKRMVPVLSGLGVDAVAALIVPAHGPDSVTTDDDQETDERDPLDVAMAFVAVGSRAAPADRAPVDAAWELASGTADLFGVVKRDTMFVEPPTGARMVRSTCLRHAVEYADENGIAPFVRTVRYTFPLEAGRTGFLHFDTPTVVYEQVLIEIFDSTAATLDILATEAEPG